jgi:anti-sigma factor RsiW
MPRASPSKRARRPSRTMRECREVVELLTEFLEGGLTPEESRRLEAHLSSCDACSELLKSLRTVRAAARTPAADAVPDDCRRALRSFLKAGLQRRPPRRRS